MDLYPLIFKPRFVEKMWGGRKLQTILGKDLPPGKLIGESWEIYDFPPGVVENSSGWLSSVVANGPLAGRTLHELVLEFGDKLMGGVATVGPHGQFPLLIKFLDAREDLSVQVHPDAQYAQAHPDAHLKTEAWYVLQHDQDARLFKGLQPGVTPQQFRSAIDDGTVENHLKTFAAETGDCHFLPSGTIHALGAGMLVAEVQTPSDTTFRVYDFNRIEPATGRPRALHIEPAMECIHFESKHERLSHEPATTKIASSAYFALSKMKLKNSEQRAHISTKPSIQIVLEGSAHCFLPDSNHLQIFTRGQTILIPPNLECVIHSASPSDDLRWLNVIFPSVREVSKL